jgi:hypothetical protein
LWGGVLARKRAAAIFKARHGSHLSVLCWDITWGNRVIFQAPATLRQHKYLTNFMDWAYSYHNTPICQDLAMRLPSTCLALCLLIAAPAHAGWQTIKSEADLSKLIVGKSWVNPKHEGWFRLRQNGKLTGGFDGKKLSGAWKWDGKHVCYTRKLGREKLPNDCIVVQVDGKNIATIRDKGRGRKTAYVPK